MADSSSDQAEHNTSEDDENYGPHEEAAQAEAVLRVPLKAEISRKCKIQTNTGNVECSKRCSKDAKPVSCNACKEFI